MGWIHGGGSLSSRSRRLGLELVISHLSSTSLSLPSFRSTIVVFSASTGSTAECFWFILNDVRQFWATFGWLLGCCSRWFSSVTFSLAGVLLLGVSCYFSLKGLGGCGSSIGWSWMLLAVSILGGGCGLRKPAMFCWYLGFGLLLFWTHYNSCLGMRFLGYVIRCVGLGPLGVLGLDPSGVFNFFNFGWSLLPSPRIWCTIVKFF